VNELDELVSEVRVALTRWLDDQDPARPAGPDDERAYADQVLSHLLDDLATRRLAAQQQPLSEPFEQRLRRDVFDRLFGVGPLQRYVDDPYLSDIHVRGHDTVVLKYRDGTKRRGQPIASSDAELIELIRWIGSRQGRTPRRFDEASPELNLRLPNGARFHAVMSVSLRPHVSVRLHNFEWSYLSELSALGMVDQALHEFLSAAVRARFNIVVGGGTGSGKTTFLRALLNEVPADERIITIEDDLELGLEHFADQHHDFEVLEARPPNSEGAGAVAIDQLVRMALRMDPDRVVVGEARGGEVLSMLLAMTQGNDGSMCTVHASSTREMFDRLAQYASMTEQRYSAEFAYRLVANAVDLVVHLGRAADGTRVVTSVREVAGADVHQVVSNEVFAPRYDGRAAPSGVAFTSATTDRLEAVEFPFHVMDKPDGWWDR